MAKRRAINLPATFMWGGIFNILIGAIFDVPLPV